LSHEVESHFSRDSSPAKTLQDKQVSQFLCFHESF